MKLNGEINLFHSTQKNSLQKIQIPTHLRYHIKTVTVKTTTESSNYTVEVKTKMTQLYV